MDIRTAAEAIKRDVSMDSVLRVYGYQPNRQGFLCCPFHGETQPSLKVYKDGWHCFGCGRGGSVVDFVMEHDGCGFNAAVKGLDDTFKLGYTKPNDPFEEDGKRAFLRFLDALTAMVEEQILWDKIQAQIELDFLWKAENDILDRPPEFRTARDWDKLAMISEEKQYQDYLLDQCEKRKREVRQWQSKKRLEMEARRAK